jgi:hypothetical protein
MQRGRGRGKGEGNTENVYRRQLGPPWPYHGVVEHAERRGLLEAKHFKYEKRDIQGLKSLAEDIRKVRRYHKLKMVRPA